MYEDIFSAFAGCSDPVVAPGEFVFSAVGLDHGHIYGMADGLLRLNYISSEEALLNGDLVITSGLGGYYPSNLVIGEVEEVITDDSGAMDYALLHPAVDFDELTEVFVITDFAIVD